ncbi:326_t:CDS:1 [Entrophospora sp. SA101]|nr:15175_t:CDS:1 [Entrophospora sp. SA101]CAJ0889302.1 326_t:CDS:1 [Entrophospora sp. SA101]
MESKKIQGQGYRLGSAHEQELEEALRDSIKSNSELIGDFKNLQVVYSKFSKNIKQENAQLQCNLKQADTDIQQIRSHALQLISEIKRLRKEISVHKSQNNRQQIAMNDYNIKLHDIQNALLEKSKETKSLQTKVKKLGSNLTSAQKNSSMKESEVSFLKYKIVELEQVLASTVSELENLKSEAISVPMVGGNNEKNMQSREQSSISNSSNISAISELSHLVSASGNKNLSKYFVCRKNMEETERIDNDISIQTSTFGTCSANDEITESSKVDTEISPKINEGTNINKISEDIIPQSQEIPNMTPYLAQPENNMSSLIESNTQMGPGPEALPLSAVASTLMSPLSAYIFLILLIIVVMWFVVLRRTWRLKRKSEQMQDVWAG